MRAIPLIAAMTLGSLIGVGGFTFIYARGYSYVSNDPAVCANCHIMENHYRAWMKSSTAPSRCATTAIPRPAWCRSTRPRRSTGSTIRSPSRPAGFPSRSRITPRNSEVTEKACRKCHDDIVNAIEGPDPGTNRLSCIRCHATVGHLE